MLKHITTQFEKYSVYKDSGVDWIGEIPAHWEVKRLKYVFTLISQKLSSKDSSLEYIGMENIESWSGKLIESDSETEGLAHYFKKDDLLFGKLRPYLAKVHLAKFEGICSTEFLVYRMSKPEYFHKLMISPAFINLVDSSTYGAKMPRANSDWIENQLIPIPPAPEQTAIVNFLDEKTAKIDTAIAQKEKLIALLKERRQIIIQQAVTKGLDPTVKFKDSGVEWIGEVPEHWEVKQLKYVLKLTNDKESSKDSELMYIGMENIESQTGKYIKTESEVEGLANKFQTNDILFGKLRPYLAKVHLAQFEGLCSTEFLVYRTDKPEYFQKLLLSNLFVNLVDASTYGAKMPRASADWIGNQFIPLPPLSEQQAIVAHIETQSAKIDKAISLQQQQIEKLKEYKAILINSAVTGKIKVG